MKQKLLFLLTALCFGLVSGVKADEPAGSYVYFNDFETFSDKTATGSVTGGSKTDATIQGNGSFSSEGGVYGTIFQNVRGENARSNYLLLPDDAMSHSADSKALTIGFWVNKKSETDFYWSPIFTAYGSAPDPDNGTPMFWTGACKAVQYNVGDGNWCDFTGAQSETSAWLDDGNWHYYTVTFNGGNVKVYIDGVVANSWTLDDTTDGQKISTFYTNTTAYSYICLGGNQRWNFTANQDKDPAFAYDDLYITNAALSAAQIQKIMFDKDPAAYIAAKKGDLTSIINGDFQVDASGWSGGGLVTGVPTRSWRGTSYANNFYETNYTSNMEYVLSNMPAGTYKVVAAARAWDGTITAKLNGTIGTHYDGIGDLATLGAPEINLNGVQMPYSNLGGFTSDEAGHNWRWIYATATLAEAGTLTITFNAQSNDPAWRWMCIDDVYLYCTNFDETDYAKSLPTISANTDLGSYANGSAISCDIVMTNPNAIMYSTGNNNITTAAGSSLNNFMYKKSGLGGLFYADQIVLYDGYNFSLPGNAKGHYFASARLYRSFTENTWSTLVVPFWPTDTRFTKKYPSELDNGVLTFSDATTDTWTTSINDKPMLVKSNASTKYIDGDRRGTANTKQAVPGDMTSGEGAPMVGTYSDIDDLSAVSGTNYVVGNDGKLHKVTGAVTVAPFRAYFNIAESEARNVISMNFDGGYTGINTIETAGTEAEEGQKDGKYLENGQIIIVKNGVKYGANGQKLN